MSSLLFLSIPLAAAGPGTPALDGVWALEMRAVTASSVPVIGDVRSVTRTGVLVRLESTEEGWLQHHHPCGSSISGGGLVKTRIPDAYFDRVEPKVLVPTVDADQGFRVDLGRFTGGWDPTVCDVVPDQIDAPCVEDWDGDGRPGVTIEVKAPFFAWVEVYVAQQTHPVLDGRVVQEDLVEGRLYVTELDNRVLGASNRLFHGQPRTRPLDAESTFRMERIGEGATCADVREHLELGR